MDMMKVIERRLVLFDGGIGTQLQDRGLAVGAAPEKWNLENPEAVREVHEAYLAAGAQVITTNSFGGSPHKLLSIGLGEKVRSVNFEAAKIAREAAGNGALVAASVGPTGAMLLMGEIEAEKMRSGFENQVSALIEGGADLIIIETMSDLDEAVQALTAARTVTSKPVIVSMTFEPGAHGFKTMMGVDIATAAKKLEDNGANALGSNCGVGIDNAVKITAELSRCTGLPILAEPNAGLPRLQQGQTVYLESPAEMASKLPQLVRAGAKMIGGCCGTTPDHISHFKQVLDQLQQRSIDSE